METYYKVNIRTEYEDLKKEKYNYGVIVRREFGCAREIASKLSIPICSSKEQGSCCDYYILDSDLNPSNVAKHNEIQNYIQEFEEDKFPIFDRTEDFRKKTLSKSYKNSSINKF